MQKQKTIILKINHGKQLQNVSVCGVMQRLSQGRDTHHLVNFNVVGPENYTPVRLEEHSEWPPPHQESTLRLVMTDMPSEVCLVC